MLNPAPLMSRTPFAPLPEMTLPSTGLPVNAVAFGVFPPIVFILRAVGDLNPVPGIPAVKGARRIGADEVGDDLVARGIQAVDPDAVAAVSSDDVGIRGASAADDVAGRPADEDPVHPVTRGQGRRGEPNVVIDDCGAAACIQPDTVALEADDLEALDGARGAAWSTR